MFEILVTVMWLRTAVAIIKRFVGCLQTTHGVQRGSGVIG